MQNLGVFFYYFIQKLTTFDIYFAGAPARGFLKTKITESPRRNILEMKRSLLTGLLYATVTINEHVFIFDKYSCFYYLLLALPSSRDFSPHFFDIFKNHITMAIKSLHSSQQLFVVTTVDQNLSIVFHRLCQNRQRPCVEFFFFAFSKFFWSHFWFGFVSNGPVKNKNI